jgi:hypothetical protein
VSDDTAERPLSSPRLYTPPGGITTLAELDQSFEDAWAAEHDMGGAPFWPAEHALSPDSPFPVIDPSMPAWLAKAGAACRAQPRRRRLPRYEYGVTTDADRAAEQVLADYRLLVRMMPPPPIRLSTVI